MSHSTFEQIPEKLIKCVVWDLDDTIWYGILAEGDRLVLNPDAVEVIYELDRRGILQSICSRNDHTAVQEQLKRFKIFDYFLFPEIQWGTKSASIKRIASNLNINLNSLAFVDDQEYEREEVRFAIPDVRCYDIKEISQLRYTSAITASEITPEAQNRRKLYQDDIRRESHRASFSGDSIEFDRSLGLELTIFQAREQDLLRASELTERTNQLNTTGRTYSVNDLRELLKSEQHIVLMASLSDRFGDYGNVGLCLLEISNDVMLMKLFLMSCRVISRGVGTIFLTYLLETAKNRQYRFLAEFLKTEFNRQMYITYKFTGFRINSRHSSVEIFEHDLKGIPKIPDHIRLIPPS